MKILRYFSFCNCKFFTDIKIAFFAALFLAFPLIASQLWMFVAPGLYKNEKHAFLPFLAATPFLFFAGAAFVYYVVMPVAWKFFYEYGIDPGGVDTAKIELEARVAGSREVITPCRCGPRGLV